MTYLRSLSLSILSTFIILPAFIACSSDDDTGSGNTSGSSSTAGSDAGSSAGSSGSAGSGGESKSCGGIAGTGCGANEYCNFGEHCGEGDQLGQCEAIAEFCTRELDPVCGCDGKDYSNPCEAAAAGVSVAKKGSCADTTPPKGSSCGGIVGSTCPSGQFCQTEIGTCDVADNAGTCTDIPTACSFILLPVCGCDGKEYSNACDASSASMNLASEGSCK